MIRTALAALGFNVRVPRHRGSFTLKSFLVMPPLAF
jgi:hypothetical protein